MTAVFGLLFFRTLRMSAFVKFRLLCATIPAELGKHHRLAGLSNFANDALEIGQIRKFAGFGLILVTAAFGWVEMDFEEIQILCLPLRPIAGIIVNSAPEAGRDGSLEA